MILVLSLADGGFFRWTWPWATLALAATAAGAWLLVDAGAPTRREIAFVAGLAALAAWQAVSSRWSPDPERSLDDALRGTVYVAAAAAFVVLARSAGSRRVLAGVVGGVTVTLLEGFVEHARQEVPDPFESDLLFQPLGYANAVGVLAAVALVLAVGLLAELPSRAAQAALVVAAAVAAAALALTESRGAWLAAGAGLVTLAAFRRWFGPWLAAVGVLVVLVLVSPLVLEPARLDDLLSDRAYYWPLAWHSLDSPLRGLGSGGFAQLWALERPVPRNAIDAHSLFLETLLELGVVGLVIVLTTLALPFVAARRLAGGWAAAAAGAYTAFLVHASLDWDWEMPAVTIAGIACGAALLAAARPRTMPP